MRTPPLLADFSHARACKPFCENSLTLPHRPEGRIFRAVNIQIDLALHAGGDHVLVLPAVHQHQVHAVGIAAGLVDF